jgi:hypothetical protein
MGYPAPGTGASTRHQELFTGPGLFFGGTRRQTKVEHEQGMIKLLV